MNSTFSGERFRQDIIGVEHQVPVLNQQMPTFINLDNAASTPALRPIWQQMGEFMGWYAGVHRGTGFKSELTSRRYDEAHAVIGAFVKADMDKNAVIMVKNTTEAINKLALRLRLSPSDVVLTTDMEHNSNELPWRRYKCLDRVTVDKQGYLNIKSLEKKLQHYYPRVKLLAVTGASNVTGYINDVHRLAQLAHAYRAHILVDGAQLIPHQPFDVKPDHDPRHIDFLAFSGHKMYAPYGSGVLIGPRCFFSQSAPEYSGGGTVKVISKSKVIWADVPDREEAGSPNVLGAVALAETIKYLQEIGMDKLAAYEQELCSYAYEKLRAIPGLKIYGKYPRIGVISFNINDIPHALLGTILNLEGGIGVRTGCFCAQNYVRTLLGMPEPCDLRAYQKPYPLLPGMVRISLAAYNQKSEIDHLVQILNQVATHVDAYRKNYIYVPQEEAYCPQPAT